MKTFTTSLVALLAASLATAQSLPPSPTASTGCEPHGDHWHCEAPATSTSGTITSSAPSTTPTEDHDHDHDEDHEHEEEEGTSSLPPSPTASTGCEPHGDHWHCEAAATPTASETLPPSPTASTGCEPHGDHWHCDAPADAAESPTDTPDAAGYMALPTAALVGGIVAAVGMGI